MAKKLKSAPSCVVKNTNRDYVLEGFLLESESQMDFSKFRGSGDLSDLTVIVSGEVFKLHKFPLYTKSDYFCDLAKSHPKSESINVDVELLHFPGGKEVFGLVADFCYNMPINLTKNNVISVKCAAEFLKMQGPGNLADLADKCLLETLSSAKLSRSTELIHSLLIQCKDIGEMAQQLELHTLCADIFIECWLSSSNDPKQGPHDKKALASAFRRIKDNKEDTTSLLDEEGIKCLISMPAQWLAEILVKAREKGATREALGVIGMHYIASILELSVGKPSNEVSEKKSSDSVTDANDQSDSDEGEDEDSSCLEESEPTGITSLSEITSDTAIDICHALDTVVCALPENALDIPAVNIDWLTKVIQVAMNLGCKCGGHLGRVAGEMTARLSPEDLCIISPMALRDIVAEDSNDECPPTSGDNAVHRDRACRLVDIYLTTMGEQKMITSEMFQVLASAIKGYPRTSTDALYRALEIVLESEADTLTLEKKSDLTKLVNFELVAEHNLKRALERRILEPQSIAVTAIKLCGKLRSELESVKSVAELQELDIQKYRALEKDSASDLHKAYSSRGLDSGYGEASEGQSKSSPPLHSEDHEEEEEEEDDDDDDDDEISHVTTRSTPSPSLGHMRSGNKALINLRHQVNTAVPTISGYRSSSRHRSPLFRQHHHGGHLNHHHNHFGMDFPHEDQLDFRIDKSFRSLDPRVRSNPFTGHNLQFRYDRPGIGHRSHYAYTKF